MTRLILTHPTLDASIAAGRAAILMGKSRPVVARAAKVERREVRVDGGTFKLEDKR